MLEASRLEGQNKLNFKAGWSLDYQPLVASRCTDQMVFVFGLHFNNNCDFSLFD